MSRVGQKIKDARLKSGMSQKMLAKNLVYTAITRAKKKLVLVGDYNSFLYGVNNDRYQKRYTSLKERLIKSVNNI